MTRIREVGTLWIGGRLSWVEELCLKSFVDAGQKITLFSYQDIPNIPAGVVGRDGREVIDTDDFFEPENRNSLALFADLFRLHMIDKNPGMIWIDTDVYCQKPMAYDSDYVFGFELPGSDRVNNAVLGLPPGSPALQAMLEFTADRYSIAPFLPEKLKEEYSAAAGAGKPVHVTQQPEGIWGPLMVTHFVKEFGLDHLVQPQPAFYPVAFSERGLFTQPAQCVNSKITEQTTAMHVWASNKRELGELHDGIPAKGSWFDEALNKHGIDPVRAVIGGQSRSNLLTELTDQLPETRIERFVDIGGNARALALELYARDNCQIDLVDLDDRGNIGPHQPDWAASYRSFLVGHDVSDDAIRVLRDLKDIRPADLAVTLNCFGDSRKIKRLKPVLDRVLHADSRLVLDIRKGSGAFPFLKGFGNTEIISESEGGDVRRVVFTPGPPAPESDDSWAVIAQKLAGDEGFYRGGAEGHSFLYVPRSKKVLVVTFDNLDIAMNKRETRRPWGYEFIEKQGWSMLAALAGGWTWYRNPWVEEQFDELRDSGFFQQFDRVVFYGASMGGYAAAAFSAACPGADVVAISPQSTLDRRLVPFETRYKSAWHRDFSGPYGDAAEASRAARRVTIMFDPYEPLDSGHVRRFTGDNVIRLRCPMLGHRLGSSLNQMGILSPIILGALDGTLAEDEFYRLLRARRDFPRYHKELFDRLRTRGREQLAAQLGRWVLQRTDNRHIRRSMKAMPQEGAEK